jgi:hypothetical protein
MINVAITPSTRIDLDKVLKIALFSLIILSFAAAINL